MIGAPLAGLLAAAGAGGGGIEYVGGKVGSSTGTTSSWSLSLTGLSGGIGSAPEAGDFVIIFYVVVSSGAFTISVTSAGYTQQALLFGNDSYDTNFLCATKLLSSAETSVNLSRTWDATWPGAAVALVFRGVNSTTPLDVAVGTSTTGNSTAAVLPDISPITDGAFIVGGIGSGTNQFSNFYTSTILGDVLTTFSNNTLSCVVGAGHIGPVAPGLMDPGVFLANETSSVSSSAAVVLALRPAS